MQSTLAIILNICLPIALLFGFSEILLSLLLACLTFQRDGDSNFLRPTSNGREELIQTFVYERYP